jgi:hypothetical protein
MSAEAERRFQRGRAMQQAGIVTAAVDEARFDALMRGLA